MSYVKTEWIDNQTPLNAENMNHIEDGIEAVPVDASVGRSSIVTKTVDIETDVDSQGNQIHRANTVNGAFSSAFGSRNIIDAIASESGVVGGLNEDYGQDNLIFGYRCKSYANQNLTGGYLVNNYGAESFAVGSSVEIQGVITIDSDGNPKSNTKSVLAIGTSVYVGEGSSDSAVVGKNIAQNYPGGKIGPKNLRSSHIVGENIVVGDGCSWIDVGGYGHNIGTRNECVYIRGYENGTIEDVTDSVIFGYRNIAMHTFNSSEKAKYIYLFGHDNMNTWDVLTPCNSNVYLFGEGLRSTKDGQFIIGKYNSGVPNAIFEIGDGESDNDRQSPFAVINGYSFISGSTVVNDYTETSCVVGWQNTINSETYGAGVFGNYNTIGAEGTEVDYPFIAGDNNTVTHNHSSAIGHYLTSTAANQMTVGKFNSKASTYNSASFQVGTGTDEKYRKTSFAVFYDKVMFPTTNTVGEYGATTQYVQNIVGDINSVLDAINGQVI